MFAKVLQAVQDVFLSSELDVPTLSIRNVFLFDDEEEGGSFVFFNSSYLLCSLVGLE